MVIMLIGTAAVIALNVIAFGIVFYLLYRSDSSARTGDKHDS